MVAEPGNAKARTLARWFESSVIDVGLIDPGSSEGQAILDRVDGPVSLPVVEMFHTGAVLVDPIKTTNVQGQRCITTWVMEKGR